MLSFWKLVRHPLNMSSHHRPTLLEHHLYWQQNYNPTMYVIAYRQPKTVWPKCFMATLPVDVTLRSLLFVYFFIKILKHLFINLKLKAFHSTEVLPEEDARKKLNVWARNCSTYDKSTSNESKWLTDMAKRSSTGRM